MIREYLEKKGIKMTDSEFKVLMEVATNDIKFNRIGFHEKTNLNDVLSISSLCYKVIKRGC
ncbi:hypothetical protein KYB31_07760 [Clostridium felsineum]|uniref:hypothetical protein n=1 Tax=Clostridium felsineum TaxID=36839 RepID=UPI00214DDE39|nr:hypothetical protein [Clostridium felsineum]MCR3758884.1 hypothetical protein [Clostridium felsineum]